MKETHAQVGLERGDVLAHACRRETQNARRGGEAAVLGRLDEGHQMLQMGHAGF